MEREEGHIYFKKLKKKLENLCYNDIVFVE